MPVLKIGALLPLFLLLGCVHIHDSSATAEAARIQSQLISQLHCQTLDLRPTDKDHFTGTGKTDQGEFTMNVTREGEKILFQGVYTGQTHGGFSGSASWSRNVNAFIGFPKAKESVQSSTSSHH